MSAERKRVGLNARVEKLDLEGAIRNRTVLPNELIQALLTDDTAAVGISVGAVIRTRGGAINGHTEAYRFTVRCGTKNEMHISSVKSIDDPAALFVESGVFSADRPVAR